MRCEICNERVFGKHGITLLGIGAAHTACFEMEKTIDVNLAVLIFHS